MKRFRITALLALGLAIGRPLNAHPLHSSYTEVEREPNGVVSLSVRLFADDFGALLDSLRAGKPVQSREELARQYTLRLVQLITPGGRLVRLEWCGMRSAENLVWVCLRSNEPVTGVFRLRNALMFDRFRDQISVIRWTANRETRTLVLNARVPEARLD